MEVAVVLVDFGSLNWLHGIFDCQWMEVEDVGRILNSSGVGDSRSSQKGVSCRSATSAGRLILNMDSVVATRVVHIGKHGTRIYGVR